MISLKGMTIICLGALMCTAQNLSIRGIVVDDAGIGIPEATVGLEVEDIFTTTDADGKFILTNSSAIKRDAFRRFAAEIPVKINKGTITITVSKNTPVAMSIHDIGGRLMYKSTTTYGIGTHLLPAPVLTTGMYLYTVKIGNAVYLFKSTPFGSVMPKQTSGNNFVSTQRARQAIMSLFDDMFYVKKEGYLEYRDSMKTYFSDTSGIVVRMLLSAGNVTDNDGTVYHSVQIGNLVWTVENLKTITYNDGTPIPHITDSTQWSELSTPAYCFYENSTNTADQKKWGALYNWYTVNTGKLAPEGWRVPTAADWAALDNYLMLNKYNWDRLLTGDSRIAKSVAARTDWIHYSKKGTIGNDMSTNNTSGFSALPGGCRRDSSDGTFSEVTGNPEEGSFDFLLTNGYWWSATETSASTAHCSSLYRIQDYMVRTGAHKRKGFSVRLVRDLPSP